MAETILINEEQPTLTINEVKSGVNENEILVDVSLDQASDLSVSTSFLLMINGESEESSEKIEGKISFDKGETTKTIVIKLPSTSLSLEDISISVHSPENTNLTSKGTIIKSEISSTTNETISRASPLKSGEVSKVYFFNLQDTSQNTFKPTESIVDTVFNLPLSGKEKRAARRLQKTLNEGGIDSQDSQGNLIKIQQVDLKINEAPANLGDSQSSEVVANPKRSARRLARALRRAEKASRNEINETNNDSNQNNNQGKVDLTSLLISREAKEVLPSTDFKTAPRTETVSSFGMNQMMSQMDLRVVEKTVTVTPVKAAKTKAVKHFKPKISIDDVTSTDETGSQVFTVTLNKVTTGTVFVDYKTVDITALENEDYTPVTGTLTFAPGTVSQTITVPIIEDTLDEMSENLKVVLSNPLGGKIKDGKGKMTITDDDGISVSPSNVTVTEEASNSTITMTMVLGQPSENVVTVDWETADRECGCATNAYAGLDYTAASGTVTFSAGETSQTFTIPLLADVLSETTEKFNIDLSNPTGGAIIDVPRAIVTIVDNDNPPSLTINNVTQAEDAGNATFTVTLSAVSGQDTKVVYNVPSGTATSGDDFTATSGILTILAGNLTGTISVPVLSDNLNEVDETATVTLSSPEGATISDGTGTLTITNDDTEPSLSINDVSYTESGSAGNATFTVTLSEASGQDVEVDYATSNATATAGADYTASTGTVTILAGNTTQTFNVPVLADTLDEVNETATLTLSNASNASISDATGTLTILDDDTEPSLSINNVSYTESGSAGNATFTVTLSAVSGQDVVVDYDSSNSTALAGSDYTAASGTVTILAGNTTQTFNVPVLVDILDEVNETATLTLSNASNASISDATGTLTILDDDTEPTLSINDVSYTESGSAGNATFTVTLSAVSGQDVVVDYDSSNSTALAGSDYTAASGTVTILAGNTTQTFNVPVLVDILDEVSETATLTLSNASNATISNATGTLTILDDDTEPTLSINDVSYTESGSAGNATFTVTLSEASGQDVEVDYDSSNATATAGSDYTAASGTVTILAGNTTQTFNVPVLVDTLDEADETATLTLSNASNATISDATGTLTIVDDEATPSLSINDVSYTESGSAGNATFTVTLSAVSGQDVVVNYASSNSTALAGSDYTAASGTVTILAGNTTQTFNVPVLVDTLDEADETATLTLSNASNASISDTTGTLTILDDDIEPSLSINDVSFTESTGNATLTVTLSEVSGQDVVVSFATSDDTATAGTDYTAGTGTVTIPAGSITATFDVSVIGDNLNEVDETATVTLSSPEGATISDGTGTLTITNDDNEPSLSINDVSYTESGSAGNATFTVTLSEVSSKDVEVDYASSNSTALAGSDYTAASGTVTILAGNTTQTFNVPVLVDILDEVSETATLTLSNASNATISDATGTLTILDDDDEPSLSINDVSYTESGSAGNATFTVTLSEASGQDVEVDYATSNATATAGADYTASTGTVTILAGNTTQIFTVPVLADTLDEVNETATLTLSNASNASISDATGTLMIIDDETTPTLSVVDKSLNEDDVTTQVTISLSHASSSDITFDWTTSADSATGGGTDFTNNSGTETITAGNTSVTVDVDIIEDSITESNETFNVIISNPSSGATIADNTGVVTIIDDEGVPTVGFASASSGNAESLSSAEIAVNLSTSSASSITVNYSVSGTATGSGTDYILTNGTLTFTPGQTSKNITIASIVSDALYEPNETVVLTLSDPTNASLGTIEHTYTITDDDVEPTLSIDDVSYTESGSAGNATFTVTLSAASGQDVEVDYDSSNATATAGSDYTAASGTATIAAGATTATFNVPIIVDTLSEVSETATLTLSNASNASISDATGTLMIIDDDIPSLSINDVSYTESGTGGNATFTVTLSEVSAQDVEVDYATSNAAATAGADYTASTGTVTILAGNTTQIFTVPVLADTLDEVNETATLTLSNASNASISDATGTLTIIDDDIPSLSINDVSYTESGTGGNATFTVTLSDVSTKEVTVNYASSNSTALAGSDYTAASGTVTIAAGATTATFNVPVLVDTLNEASETATLTLSSASNATISDATGTLTILDDDTEPSLSINNVSYTESGSAGNATFTVTLSAVSGQDVVVDYDSSNSTALAGSDYTAASGTVTILAGNTTQTFNVPVLVDILDEVSETATLTLSNASNATISNATGTLTILDDDTEPTLSINDVSYTESGSAGNATFTVTLSAVSGQDVEVDYDSSNSTALAGSDYTAASGTVTILAGNTTQTFNVPVLVDTLDEVSELAILTLSNASNASISDATGRLSIFDDDTAPTLSINDVSYTESGSAGNATFTVTLSEVSSKVVTVNYASSNATAAAGSDYTAASGTVTIAAGATTATFNVPVLVDTLNEVSETATLTLSNASNATISDATGTLTILDDDTEPTLSINDVSYTESGSAGNATFTVTLSAVSGQDVVVNYASSNSTALAGSDYTAASGTVTILAGNTTQTFNVPVLVDTLDEADETATLTLSNASNASISDTTGTLTILDDDSAPSISINNNAMTENAANLTFTVSLSTASSKEITVNYAAADITAIGAFGAGTDYQPVSSTALTFAPGETSKTIDVRVWEDAAAESTETFAVNLTSPSNATISDSQGIGTIYNDDVAEAEPSLTINNVAVTENAGSMTFTVTASGTYSEDVTFNYTTANGSALSSSDYTSTSSTGTITAGSTTTTITVNVTNDSVYESTEVLYVNLSSPTNATISDSQGAGTIYNDDAECDADGITYFSNVVVNNSADDFQNTIDGGSGRSNDHPNDRFIITAEQVDSQWSGSNSQTFDTYTGYSGKNGIYNNIVYGKNKAGNANTTNVQNGDYFNSYLVFLNNDINRRTSGTGTIRFEHNIMGIYYGQEDTTSTPAIMSQFEKSGAFYASTSASSAGNRDFEIEGGGDWIRMTTSGTYAYKEITLGAKNGQKGDFMRVITNSCLTDGIVVGVEYTTSSGLKGLTDHEGNFAHYIGDDVTFNIGGVVLGTATAEDLSAGRVFLQDIADVDRTTLNGTYLENMATFLQSLDDNNDAYDNIVISQAIRDALVDESLDLRTASEEEVEQLINEVGGIWVEEADAMTHVKDMLIKYSDLTEADFGDTPSPSSSDVLVDIIDTDLLVDEYKASDSASILGEPPLAGVDASIIDLSDLLDVPGDEIDSLIEENDTNDEQVDVASIDQFDEGENETIGGSVIAPFELVDSLLGEVTETVVV